MPYTSLEGSYFHLESQPEYVFNILGGCAHSSAAQAKVQTERVVTLQSAFLVVRQLCLHKGKKA